MSDLPSDLITAKEAVQAFKPLINTLGAFYDAVRRKKFPTYGCTRRIYVSRAEVAAALRGNQECRAAGKLNARGKMVFASRG